ncbi:MAG TPA: porin family protein [Saprospiraceae bacterium]|nr:porin family protein [Saprospiraceae bacterium]
MKTTKWMFALLCSVFMVTDAFTQMKDRFSIGPRGGINFSNVTNVDESESITGVVLGLTSTYSLNEHSGLTLDILYSVEGYQGPFETYKLRYLQIPIYFDVFFGELGNRFRPKVYVGASPAFFLGGTLNELDVNETYFNKFIIHATGGLGFNYRIASRIWLNTDLRAFWGLSDIRSENFNVGEAINPRTVQLSLGLAYGLTKLESN